MTESASNGKAAWEIIGTFPHITAIGCALHALNLLLNEFMKLDIVEKIYRRAKGRYKICKIN